MDSNAYMLRRGKTSSRPTAKSRRKLKAVSDELDLDDGADTYSDSPNHLYGLDKVESELPASIPHAKTVPSYQNCVVTTPQKDSIAIEDRSISEFQPLHKAVRYLVYVMIIILTFEVVIWCDRWFFIAKAKDARTANDSNVAIEILQNKLNAHVHIVQQLNAHVKELQQKTSCHKSLEDQPDDTEQKAIIRRLQEQILTTVSVISTMNSKIEDVQDALKKSKEEDDNKKLIQNGLCSKEECNIAPYDVYESINSALDLHRADALGLPDFALESAGGRVHARSSTCDVGTPIIKVFGIPLWQDPRSPYAVINPANLPGNCWPMKGSSGYIVIKLAFAIDISMVSLEHLDVKLDRYSKETYQSAPKDFEVYAWLNSDGGDRMKLGFYTYHREKSCIQTFKLQAKPTTPVSYVELRVINNYGNNYCTCIYRFRVHGQSHSWNQFESEGHE